MSISQVLDYDITRGAATVPVENSVYFAFFHIRPRKVSFWSYKVLKNDQALHYITVKKNSLSLGTVIR